ncbi:hypothetical protein GHT06_020183 [Daphnia sinensis]|uniref:Tr-type G domain-containing protein n=1 Tax=Daphnia sinensis TaxID=1820382 RepID=A0AAD5L2A3_9CRUS|nr:hypothetical protein GHT06_020183 [Daphnia sinensis]
MARHRNIRTMNYDEEYDGYDDVYGHSVEDDYASSPSMQHFLYDRSQEHQMSAYMQSDIPEEDELVSDESKSGNDVGVPSRIPPLGELEQAQLYSCLDLLRDRMGDALSEQAGIDAILACNFDAEKALDQLLKTSVASTLSKSTKSIIKPKPAPSIQVEKIRGSEVRDGKTPVKVVSAKKVVATGFSLPPTGTDASSSADRQPAKQESAVEETSRQLGCLQTPGATPRSTSPADREATPSATPKSQSRTRENRVDVASEYVKERSGTKALLNLVVVGHVDAGKSTLMGHMLFRLGQVSSKQMHKYEQESKKLGKQSFMYAWVLDETGEERSRGITMDVAQSQFETETKSITLLDAPGHRDFIPNMIFGAAQADVALLVVDATTGEFETGFESGGQTREHALLVRSLGVSQLGVVVNKLDMVGWSRDRFNEIVARLGAFLKQAGYKEQDVFYVPVSGLTGENLTALDEPKLTEWYSGPTLLQAIDKFRPPERPLNRPVRLVISDIFKSVGGSSGCCLAGRLESGMMQTGDKLLIMPLNEIIQIKNIAINEVSKGSCFAGDQVVLTVSGADLSDVSLGSVLCDPSQPIKVTSRIEARIVIFNIDIPITKGYPVVIHYQSLSEAATISKLIAQIHKSTGEVVRKRPRCLTKQTSGLVEIEISRPICMELYKDYRELGRFMIRANGTTIAAGLVTGIL